MRNWEKTRQHTQKLWELVGHSGKIDKFKKESKGLGIRDSLNLEFVREIQDMFRDCMNQPPSEKRRLIQNISLHVKTVEDIHGVHIFNPFLRLKGESC